MLDNVYITIILIVILMFLDYFLTIKSIDLAKQGYSKYIKVESYELNPLFKESVNKMQYSLKHFLGVVFVSVIVYAFYYSSVHDILFFNMNGYFMFQGIISSIFIFINASHIRNLIVFNTIKKDKSLLSGKLKQKHLFSLKSYIAESIKLFIILFSLFLFSPSYFTFGFALGPLLIANKNRAWIKKHLRERKESKS